jgi:hypothetical protein
MSNYRSTRYARLAQINRREGIAAYYRHKAVAEMIPETAKAFRPRVSADARITIWLKGQPSLTFSSYKLPNGKWTISPTLSGQKVQQVLMRA